MRNLLKLLGRNPYAERAAVDHWTAGELLTGGYRLVMNPLFGGYADGFDRGAEHLFLRQSWAEPQRFKLSEQPEWFNIAGLYWKPL